MPIHALLLRGGELVLRLVLAVALAGLLVKYASATPIIDVGDHVLLANTPGQSIAIFVSGGGAVEGLNLNVQIADGGTALAVYGGSIDGPAISDLDVVTGTIFAGNNTGADDPEILALGTDYDQLELRTITTDVGTVAAAGLLATITIDTTGYFAGTFELRLFDTINGPSDFAGIDAAIDDGTITIVPEPGSRTLLCLSTVIFLAIRRRGFCRA